MVGALRVSANDGSMDSNPAPGNKAGGITTILEKSLGAIAKGGIDGSRRCRRVRPAHAGTRPGVHGHARVTTRCR